MGGHEHFLYVFRAHSLGGAKACWAQVAVSHGSVVVVLVLVIVLVMVLLVVVVRITKLTKLTTLAKLNYVTKLN